MGIFDILPDPDPDTRPSTWLVVEQAKNPSTKPCGECKGTGSSGFVSASAATIVCSCGGFGY